MKATSEPKQQRSIDKKNRIIEAGYALFNEKGMRNTNTAEIAKRAGVSTGIVYRYFEDKHEIFIASLPMYFALFNERIRKVFSSLSLPLDYEKIIDDIIEAVIASHDSSPAAYAEISALSFSDPEVKSFFDESYARMNDELVRIVAELGIPFDFPREKMHLMMTLVEQYVHELVFSRDDNLDYVVMKKLLIRMILSLLSA